MYEDPRVDDVDQIVRFTFASDPEHEDDMRETLVASVRRLSDQLGYDFETVGEADVLREAFAIVCRHGLLDWDGKAALIRAAEKLENDAAAKDRA